MKGELGFKHAFFPFRVVWSEELMYDSSEEKKQRFLCYSNWSRGDCRASFVLVAQSVLSAVPLRHNLSLSALRSFKSSVF